MKIFITTYNEIAVGIFEETIIIDWKSLDASILRDTDFLTQEGEHIFNREYYRKTISAVFEDITGGPVKVQFEDENDQM